MTYYLDIFYMYLKWKKDDNRQSLRRIPKTIWVFILLLVVVVIAIFVFMILNWQIPLYISCVAEFILGIVITIYSNNRVVKQSKGSFQKTLTKCHALHIWLKEINFDKKNKIETLISYLIKHYEKEENKIKENKKEIDKWFQWLIIPISLSLIYAIQSSISLTSEKIAWSIISLFIPIILYIMIKSAYNIYIQIYFYQTEGIKYFIYDLQGVLDLILTTNNEVID